MKYKAIIFDFNGVLWKDEALQEKAWQQISQYVRGKKLDHTELSNIIHGRQNKDIFEYLLQEGLDNNKLEDLIQLKEKLYRRLCLSQSKRFKLAPGSINLLNYIVKNKILHTIVTSSGKENLTFFIKHLNLEKWFDISKIVYDDRTIAGKPNPDAYLRGVDNLGISPSNCVVLEDSISGIISAYKAKVGKIIAIAPRSAHDKLVNIIGINKIVEKVSDPFIKGLF